MPVDFDIGHFSHISRLSSSIPLERLLLPQVDRSSARLVPPGKLPLLSLPSSTMAAKPAASETLPSQVSVDQQYFKGVAAISLFGKTGESGEEMGIPGQRKKAETVLQQVEKCFVTSGRIDRENHPMSAVLHEPLTAGTLEDILLKYSDDTRLSDVEVPASVRWLPGRKLFSLAQGNHRREILASLNERDDKAMWKV